MLGMSDSRTKWSGSKQNDSNFVYKWSGRDTHADHGVGFIVDEQHSQSIVEIIPIKRRLNTHPIKEHIKNYMQCYSPLNTDEEDVKDEFFENLHDTLADISSSEQIHLMGDFNAEKWGLKDVCTYTNYLGTHGRGPRNNNGERLLEIWASHHLGISFWTPSSNIKTPRLHMV